MNAQTAKNKANAILNRYDAENDLKPAAHWETAELARAVMILAERVQYLEEYIDRVATIVDNRHEGYLTE